MSRAAIATIPPNLPFLEALAAWWLHECAARGTPEDVADAFFLLPTRRAARGLTDAFLRQSGGAPLLLPRIAAFGGVDEAPLALAGALWLEPAVPVARRLAVLARLILALRGRHGAPTLVDRAWLLAEALADLLDEAARSEIDLAARLPDAAGRDFAAHWQVTVEFLRIITEAWPAWLAEEGLCDVAARQIALLDAQSAAWQAVPPSVPVIAAGTTAAIPAVARLLRVVSRLPRGQLVLPGLDTGLDAASWDALSDTHPQASLRALLTTLGVRRDDVAVWHSHPAVAPPARVDALRLALLPAGSLNLWHDRSAPDPAGLRLLDPADQQEEAASIALLLRGALEQPGATAALVTPDRALAQRVTAELLRFGVVADDSAGEKLAETPPSVLLRLLATAVAEQLRPVPLLALLKHPLVAAGLSPAACRRAARTLEHAALRGPMPAPGVSGLRATPANAAFLDRLEGCLGPVLALGSQPVDAEIALRALLTAAEALAGTDVAPGAALLWRDEEGEALASAMTTLLAAFADLPPVSVADLPALLNAALAGIAVRSRRALRGRDGAEHPRVFIYGLLEARLQSADLVILGGLVEGVWPPQTDPGPWMNRAMRAAVGLPSPEQRIGLAAHDFVSAACAGRTAVLSAPRRRDRAPAVPSRWLERLQALLGPARLAAHPATFWARALDRPDGAPQPVGAPMPRPPVALRPRRLRVTEIETWLRDPYAIYARHVLRLQKLKPLEESADAADYGTIVHAGMHRFYQQFGEAWPADATARLRACMDAALDDAHMRPALAAWWRPRLHRIADWVAEAEATRRAALGRPRRIVSEYDGSWQFDAPEGPFQLRGRADRIERLFDGGIAILDYKTGAPPSKRDVEEGRAPQLPLEGAMVAAGAFGAAVTGTATDLTYWHISGGFHAGEAKPLFRGNAAQIADIIRQAEAALRDLVAAFDNPARAYLSQPHPGSAPRFSDYARLARVAEWAGAEDPPTGATLS
jgi:ATP-dependent helicase/nuclease subunit B